MSERMGLLSGSHAAGGLGRGTDSKEGSLRWTWRGHAGGGVVAGVHPCPRCSGAVPSIVRAF